MSNIILSTQLVAIDDEVEQVNITLFVEEEDWIGHFNRLQVYRSESGDAGPFEEITDEAWSPPRLPESGGDRPLSPVTGALVNIVGETLELTINNEDLIVTFTGVNPLTRAQVATQITNQSLGMLAAYVDADGEIVIEGVYPGRGSRVVLTATDGSVALGLEAGEAIGKDPRISLAPGQVIYTLTDTFGSRDYFYRSRFFNIVTGGQSESSVSHSPKNVVGVAVDNVIIGYLDVVALSGKPQERQEVCVYNEYMGPPVDGRLVVGGSVVKYTDESGHVEFNLVRGQRLTVSVQGTNLVRTITVPTDPAVKLFSLFDPSIGEQDVFRVAVPDLIVAERRAL